MLLFFSLTGRVSTPDARLIAEASNILDVTSGLASLITVVSTRMDTQQEQLKQLQGANQPSMDLGISAGVSGTIPKCPQVYQPCGLEAA
jgi:hypothetical protein